MNQRDRGGALGPIVGALALSVVMLWPARDPFRNFVGDPLGETDNHVWMFWRQLAARGHDGPPLANAPDGVAVPLMDVVNLPLYALGSLGGPVLAWNLLALGSIGLALWGGWLLGTTLAGRQGAWVSMAVLGTAPFLAGVVDFGISEAWPLGLVALHLAFLVRHARSGGLGDAVLAVLLLGGVGLSGWYQALFVLVIEAVLVPVLWWRSRRVGLWLQGGIGLAMVLPVFLSFRGQLGLWSHRWIAPSPGPPGPREDWATLPVFGTDLLNPFLPSLTTVHPSKAVYLGLVGVVLAGLGLVRARPKAWPWALTAGVLLCLSWGHWPTLAGKAMGFPGPALALVELVPELQGLSHWHRAVGPAAVCFAALAAWGAQSLPHRRWLGPLLGIVVAVDGIAFGQTAWPRSMIPAEAPEVYASLEGEGGVIDLPFDNSRELFADDPARIYNRWQVLHGRQTAEHYEGADALLERVSLVVAAHEACWNKSTLPPYYAPPPEMRNLPFPEDDGVIAEERAQLRAWGYRWIVLHRDRCRLLPKAIQGLDLALGAGQRVGEDAIVWPL